MPDFEIYMKYRNELDEFENFYFDSRNNANSEKNLDLKIDALTELIEYTKQFETFCKNVGLSKHVNDLYKKAHNSQSGTFNMFKDDRDNLKRCKLLKKLFKKMDKLALLELQSIDEYIKSQFN